MHFSPPDRLRMATAALTVSLLVTGCGNSDEPTSVPPPPGHPTPSAAMFEITLVNLTAGPPLSPLVAVAHTDAFSLFKVGDVASVALENIAEAGDTAPLKQLLGDAKSVIASVSGPAAPLAPGAANMITVSLTVPLATIAETRLSLATMLANTNDGFTGLSGESLAALPVAGSRTFDLIAYDAATERNSESADTVPGPASAGAGGQRQAFNALRNDMMSTVHVHPGGVSRDDDLPGSALTGVHRWDNPVARLIIRRTRQVNVAVVARGKWRPRAAALPVLAHMAARHL